MLKWNVFVFPFSWSWLPELLDCEILEARIFTQSPVIIWELPWFLAVIFHTPGTWRGKEKKKLAISKSWHHYFTFFTQQIYFLISSKMVTETHRASYMWCNQTKWVLCQTPSNFRFVIYLLTPWKLPADWSKWIFEHLLNQ